MQSTIIDDMCAIHGRSGWVSYVPGHPQAPPEHLNTHVYPPFPHVHHHPLRSRGGQEEGDVGGGGEVEGFEGGVRKLLQAYACQLFALLATVTWRVGGVCWVGFYWVGVCWVDVCWVGGCWVDVCWVGGCLVGVCWVGVYWVGVCWVGGCCVGWVFIGWMFIGWMFIGWMFVGWVFVW